MRAIRLKYPEIVDLETWCTRHVHGRGPGSQTQSLDIGCGPTPRNPFHANVLFGVDILEDPTLNVRCADLAIEPIPFASNSFDYVTAFEFLEHVPRVLYVPGRRLPFIELMNEIHRVLKPGGVLLSHTPAYPYGEAFQDPTHVNIITENTFPKYFDDRNGWARSYGFTGSFEVVAQAWKTPDLITLLRKHP